MQLTDLLQQDDQQKSTWLYPVWAIWLVWLPFLAPSVVSLFQMPGSWHKVFIATGLLLFIAVYMWVAWQEAFRLTHAPLTPTRLDWQWLVPIALMIVLSAIMPLVQNAWGLSGFIYTSASLTGRLKIRQTLPALGGLLLLTVLLGVLTAASLSTIALALFIELAIGMNITMFSQAFLTNWRLRLARREIARLAISEERLRFARDLHDLLGHTLSLITIKSELAGQLIAEDPQRAQREVHDIEAAARTALQEVREAVAGYRKSTLTDELQHACELLTAAGIDCTIQNETAPLPVAVEALLTWVVREGITNVIRHSRARHCVISLTRQADQLCMSVADDGQGRSALATAPLTSGNGLRGLAERVTAMEGSYEAGPVREGGFRLLVRLPVQITRDGRVSSSSSAQVKVAVE